MGSFVLSCCSTADMPAAFFEKRDIAYACFHYYLGGKMYLDDLGKTMDFKEFYDRMEQDMERMLQQRKQRFSLLAERLDAGSPLKKLSGGYGYISLEGN